MSDKYEVLPDTSTDGDQVKHVKKGLSVTVATVFIVGELAGGGILSLPKALSGTGWSGVALIIFFCFNAGFAGVCLAKCWTILETRWPEYKVQTRKPYAEIGMRAYGKWTSRLVSVGLNANLFGGSTVFLLLTSNTIQSLTKHFININSCVWVLIVAALLTPMMFLGSPQDFWPAAFAAMIGTAIGSTLLLVNLAMDWSGHHGSVELGPPSFESFFIAFGTVLFAFGGASAFPTFQNDMKDKSKFPKAVVYGFTGLLFLYLPIAIVGYAIYGSNVNDNIIGNLEDGALKTVVSISFGIHLFFAFLIVINPVLLEFEEMFNIPNKFGWKRCLLRTLIMVVLVFVAESVPTFGKILSLVGGSSVTMMTFLFPPLFFWKLNQPDEISGWPGNQLPAYVKAILVEVFLIGLFGGGVATYSAVKDIVAPDSFTLPCYIQSFNSNSTK